MVVKEKIPAVAFRLNDEYREMMEKLGRKYGTRNMTKVLKTVIEKEYNAQFINLHTQSQDG